MGVTATQRKPCRQCSFRRALHESPALPSLWTELRNPSYSRRKPQNVNSPQSYIISRRTKHCKKMATHYTGVNIYGQASIPLLPPNCFCLNIYSLACYSLHQVVPFLILHYCELLHLHHVTEQTEKCLCFTRRYVKHFYMSSKYFAHIF